MVLDEYFTPSVSIEYRRERIKYAAAFFTKEGKDFENQIENLFYKDDDMSLLMGKPGKDGKHDLTPIVKSRDGKFFKYEERETFKQI